MCSSDLNQKYMNQSIYKIRALFVVILVGVISLFALAWQSISIFVQKGIADSKNIRVAENNVCTTDESKLDKPNFSGCNSIL